MLKTPFRRSILVTLLLFDSFVTGDEHGLGLGESALGRHATTQTRFRHGNLPMIRCEAILAHGQCLAHIDFRFGVAVQHEKRSASHVQ